MRHKLGDKLSLREAHIEPCTHFYFRKIALCRQK